MDKPLKYKRWHDFDLHIALEVEEAVLLNYFEKGKNSNIETRGISDHGFIKSIYFRDPNGYVIELTSPIKSYKKKHKINAKDTLEKWTLSKK